VIISKIKILKSENFVSSKRKQIVMSCDIRKALTSRFVSSYPLVCFRAHYCPHST
jgi:hypothetical protein